MKAHEVLLTGPRLRIALVAVSLLVAACGAAAPSPSVTPSASPSSSPSPPQPSPSPSAAPFPSPTSAASVPGCSDSQLSISVVHTGAGLGAVTGYLQFANTSATTCKLHGWPTLVTVTADGHAVTAKDATNVMVNWPLVSGVPTAILAPGAAAAAAFAGSDTPGASGTCPPSYQVLRVTPPGGKASVTLSAWNPYAATYLPACTPVEVTMVLPETELPDLEATPAPSPSP